MTFGGWLRLFRTLRRCLESFLSVGVGTLDYGGPWPSVDLVRGLWVALARGPGRLATTRYWRWSRGGFGGGVGLYGRPLPRQGRSFVASASPISLRSTLDPRASAALGRALRAGWRPPSLCPPPPPNPARSRLHVRQQPGLPGCGRTGLRGFGCARAEPRSRGSGTAISGSGTAISRGLGGSPAGGQVVVDHAGGLHQGVGRGGAYEGEAPSLQFLCQGLRLRGDRRDLRQVLRARM